MAKQVTEINMVIGAQSSITITDLIDNQYISEGKVITLTPEQEQAILAIINPLVIP